MDEFTKRIIELKPEFSYVRVLSVIVKRPRFARELDNKYAEGSISISISLPDKFYSDYHAKEKEFFALAKQVLTENGLGNLFLVIYDTPISYEELRIAAQFLDLVYAAFPILIGKVGKSSVKIKVEHSTIDVSVTMGKLIHGWCIENGFVDAILEQLSNYYIYPVVIHLIASDEQLKQDAIEQDFNTFSTTFTVSDKQRLLGRNIGKHPNYISSINSPVDNVVVAGKISQKLDVKEFEKKARPKLDEQGRPLPIDPNAPKKFGYIYKFILDDTTGTIELCFFANQPNQLLESLVLGNDLLVEGAVNDFNGVYSINVKNLAFCKVNYAKILDATKLLPTPTEYKLVFPIAYSVKDVQSNLLDNQLEESDGFNAVNEYTTLAVEEIYTEKIPRLIYEIAMAKVSSGVITEYMHLYIKLKTDDARMVENKTKDISMGHKLKTVFPDIVKFLSGTTIVGFNATGGLIDLLNGIGKPLRYAISSPCVDFSSIQKKVPTLKDLYQNYQDDIELSLKKHSALKTALCMAKGIIKVKFSNK